MIRVDRHRQHVIVYLGRAYLAVEDFAGAWRFSATVPGWLTIRVILIQRHAT